MAAIAPLSGNNTMAPLQASANAAMLECLCQLQEMGGFAQLAGAIMAGDGQRALRSYRVLQRRAPPRVQADDVVDDPLDRAFIALGQLLARQDIDGAAAMMASLQALVAQARRTHHHGTRPADPETSPNEAGAPQSNAAGHIDIKV